MQQEDGERLIFISHSGQDTWVARQIAREVEQCGARCFLDSAEKAAEEVANTLRAA